MTPRPATSPPGFFTATSLLLGAALRRQRGRMRAHVKSTGNPAVLFVFMLLGLGVMYWAVSTSYLRLAGTATRMALERGDVLVTREPLDAWQRRLSGLKEDADDARAMLDESRAMPPSDERENNIAGWQRNVDETDADVADARAKFDASLDRAAAELAAARGGTPAQWRDDIATRLAARPPRIVSNYAATRPWSTAGAGLIALLLALWWFSIALASGDGAIDALRRRHPMWEWYATFPIRPAAAFVAEALAPALVNPGLLAAPVLFAALAASYAGSWTAALAAYPVALPLVLVAVVWSKALEVGVMLRATPRNRGTWFVVLAIVSFVALFGPLFASGAPALVRGVVERLQPLLHAVPDVGILLDTASPAGWAKAMAASLALSVALALPAFALLRFAVARGIEGGFGRETIESGADRFVAPRDGRGSRLRDPLLRKDLLWLKRDRSAWLQVLVFPVLLGAMMFLMFGEGAAPALTWHQAAGLLVGFGGYLSWIAGPRALASETAVLSVALSWPRPLEDVLRTKVNVVFALTGVVIAVGFALLLWNYPGDAVGILAVAAAWLLFAHLLAEKSITTIRATGASGETEPPSLLRGFVAGLGNFAFAIGVYHAQWQIAIAAIVLNAALATALWQDFRHRLPYLFDPQSEPAPMPPTVLNSVIAIVGLLEISALVSLPIIATMGAEHAMFAQTVGYAVASAGVFAMTVVWYARRGAGLWRLLTLDDGARRFPLAACAAAVARGAALALAAQGYLALLHTLPLPALHTQLNEASEFLMQANARAWLAVMAVAIAPWIEEFLFRGLLFRSLLAAASPTRAIVVSSALFAILHPWPFWPMIFAIGAVSALIYWRWRALLPCVLLHLTYNALVVAFG